MVNGNPIIIGKKKTKETQKFDKKIKKLEHERKMYQMDMETYLKIKQRKEHLKECAHCHKLFIGRKNKLCCSTSCKDYNNEHYGKKIARKLKEQQEQKGQEKTENDTNNQQK